MQLTFSTVGGVQEATLGTYAIQLPALSFDIGGGNFENHPPLSLTGNFTSELIDDESPYRARLKILTSTHELPMNEFILDFDFDRSRLPEIRLSRFSTINTENPVYFFNGYWRKTN